MNAAEYALSEMLNILADGDAMQEKVDEGYSTLYNAVLNMAMAPDRNALESEVAISQAIYDNLDNYVEAGKTEFIAALEAAKEVLAKEDATQEEINAVNALQPIPVDTGDDNGSTGSTGDTDSTDDTGSEDDPDNDAISKTSSSAKDSTSSNVTKTKVAKTGDETFILIMAIFALCLSLLVIYNRKKAKK